jgi:MFS family permease
LKTLPESLKKIILIGLSLFLFKSVLIIYAYAFNSGQYNLFNQSYYTASLLILFGALGFNISQTRIPIKTLKIFLFVTFNILITYLILHLISIPLIGIADIISIVIYSTFSAVGGIMNFKLLFEGKYQEYFWVMLFFTIAHLCIIPVVIYFNVSIFPSLSFFIILWFLLVYKFFDKENVRDNIYKDYYKIGFSAFVINSAVSLGLAGDKFIVNHFFTTDIANAYTFAWGLTAPIFYIGNMIEKYLYAEQKPDKNRILKKGFIFSLLLISVYTLSIVAVVKFFPSLLPGSVSKENFGNIFIFMITGYAVFVIFHFPLNSYLFKVIDTEKQKRISIYYSFIILFFVPIFYFMMNYSSGINYKILLITVWLYIFVLLIVKALIIFNKKASKSSPETIDIVLEEMQEIP